MNFRDVFLHSQALECITLSMENTIAYWRKFVSEYYAPRSMKRWCLSLYDNVGQHALGVFPQASTDAWHCDICGSKSGRGFEATYEVLPRLNEIKFGSGVIDELLFVDLPRERRFANGIMLLEYGKAVQESVYEQLRVVREGQLRIIFTQELKILSWDFCARRHEELLSRRLMAPQVSQLLQVAQKCQSIVSDCGSEGVSSQDLQTNSNMVVAAGQQCVEYHVVKLTTSEGNGHNLLMLIPSLAMWFNYNVRITFDLPIRLLCERTSELWFCFCTLDQI